MMPDRTFRKLPALAPLLVVLALLLPALLTAAEEGGEAAHQADLGKIFWDMGVKVIDFAILAFFLTKFLSKPLGAYLSSRAESIRKILQDLKDKKASNEKDAAEATARLQGIDEEIGRLKAATRLEMEKEREQVLAEAHHAAQEIIRHTHETIRREFAKAKADLHREASDLSLSLAEELIVKNINDKDHRRLTEEYVQKITGQP